jgi:hypothetical protein
MVVAVAIAWVPQAAVAARTQADPIAVINDRLPSCPMARALAKPGVNLPESIMRCSPFRRRYVT